MHKKTLATNIQMHTNCQACKHRPCLVRSFRGGTHPDATVTIDGKEIRLSPDGTFRYHFTLPDGDFAIPIIARSPDGVEERSATLSFVRGTARKGEVGATTQPSELSPLIGKK